MGPNSMAANSFWSPELQGADFGALRPKRLGEHLSESTMMRVETSTAEKYVSDIAKPRRMNANFHCHVPELRSRLGLVFPR